MKLAIVSSSNLPEWEQDDQPFFDALTTAKIEFEIVAWDSDIDWQQFDVCLIRTTWDYQDKFEEFTQWINTVSKQTLLLNQKDVLTWNSHKKYLKELNEQGIAIAPSEWLLQGGQYQLKQLMTKNNWTQGFIKPLIGANARECYRFDLSNESIANTQEHVDRLTLNEDLVLQPYLQSVEDFGETSGIFFDHEFSHGTRKIPVKGDFRVQDDYGAKDYPYQLSPKEEQLAQQALEYVSNKFGKLLYARIDYLHDQDGSPYLNEMELIEPSLFFRHGGKASAELLLTKLKDYYSNYKN